jgi:hypothetical protein
MSGYDKIIAKEWWELAKVKELKKGSSKDE